MVILVCVTLVVLKFNHFQLRDLNPREQFFEDVKRHACDDWDLKYSEMDSFASLSYDQQLSHVEISPCFAVLTPLRVFQVDYFVTYVIVSQGWSPLQHRLWVHSVMVSFSPSFLTVQLVLFPITPIQLHLYCIKFTKELGTTLRTRLGISYGDMMGLGREELGFGSRVLIASVVGSLSDGILFSIIFHGAVGQGVQKCPDGSGREESRKHQEDALWIRLVNVTKRTKRRSQSDEDKAASSRLLPCHFQTKKKLHVQPAVKPLQEEDLITEDTRQKHTTSSHFTSLHPQLHHHRSSFTDNFTYLKADHKTKERRERSLPALILRAPQLVTYSTREPRNPHNSRLIKDLTHG
ncbi:hypothetical protein F2Q69_00007411 [Brassica cretica]|uniref:Uncharacterized protein n=1 Tax=Brassica cretica TaxID=69181 RepID=A0A8S9PD97_BRACR|nr:hypothetical protein F2Q69_00007411 [Brassica cretica]